MVTERYANLLNCKVVHTPLVYLGILIDANPRIADTWSPVISNWLRSWGGGGVETQIIIFCR